MIPVLPSLFFFFCFVRTSLELVSLFSRRPQEETIQGHLRTGHGCMCRMPADACGFQLRSHPPVADAVTYLSAVRLLLYTRRRRRPHCRSVVAGYGGGCPAVERACSALLRPSSGWLEYLLAALRCPAANAYVRHAAVCAASETVLTSLHTGRRLVDGLLRLSVVGPSTSSAALAVSALARALDTGDATDPAVVLLLDRLRDVWTDLVTGIVRTDGPTTPALAELVRLWMSVLWSPSSSDRGRRFRACLPDLQRLLYRTDTDPHLWLNTVRLFGAGLGLRSDGGDSSLAAHVTDGLTRRRLLYFMGKQNGGRRALQETALLAMRSLRVRALEPASAAVAADVVDCLDSYVKSTGLYEPDVPFCRWLCRLMCDRDDAAVECLTCALDVADAAPAALEPLDGFVEFLACVSYEPDVLLDMLIADDANRLFLPYALKILKAACRRPGRFFRCCGDQLHDVMGSLIRLRLKMLRLHRNRVFPYNVGPVAKLIQRCDELYTAQCVPATNAA